jgi:nucleotide-binding universal stress UspA family protein
MALAFYRILLAYDGSAASRMALQYACALARPGADLVLANACHDNNFVASAAAASFFPPVDPTPLIAAAYEECDTVLRAAVGACAARGIPVEKVFVHDSTVDGIIAAGQKKQSDLIVVGTIGRKGVARTVLGSIAEGIIQESDVPVLVVTGHAKVPHRTRVFERALVALDDSAPSQAALSIAARLATTCGTRLSLCTVIDQVAATNDAGRTFEADLHAAGLLLLQRAKATADIAPFVDGEVVVGGKAATVIERTAMQRNCDVIIVGSHSRHGFAHVFEGSVAETLARSSAVPVLVIPVRSRCLAETPEAALPGAHRH